MRILVDADACPVKDEVVKVADRHGLLVQFVSNRFIRLPHGRAVERVLVGDAFDAADDWIAERADASSIVITGDILLAERSLKAGALVLGPTGKPFDGNSIGAAIAMRALTRDLREMGEIRGGPAEFAKADRSRFLQALETAVQTLKRRQPTAP